MRVPTPRNDDTTYHEDGYIFVKTLIADFPEDTFRELLERDPEVDDTRSQIVQVRFANGDLLLGFFPQGDSYTDIEGFFA
jgi:hypothetical protein